MNRDTPECRVIGGDEEAGIELIARAICYAFPSCQYCIIAKRCLAETSDLRKTPQWTVAAKFREEMRIIGKPTSDCDIDTTG